MLSFKKIMPDTRFIGKNIKYFKSVDSTNNVALQKDYIEGTLIIAEKQTAGRGRMGRSWVSKPKHNILMSLILTPDLPADKINLITLTAGLSVCKVLINMFNLPFKIKWPNDIVANGKKLCGILTEGKFEKDKPPKAVAGIGINVNTKNFPAEIKDIATSLYILTGKKTDKTAIVKAFAEEFEKNYMLLLNNKEQEIIREYTSYCVNIKREVLAVKNGEEIRGIATGVSEKGELIIKKEDSTLLNINSGEVTVRGFYGY